jgi:hypothetical protein
MPTPWKPAAAELMENRPDKTHDRTSAMRQMADRDRPWPASARGHPVGQRFAKCRTCRGRCARHGQDNSGFFEHQIVLHVCAGQ